MKVTTDADARTSRHSLLTLIQGLLAGVAIALALVGPVAVTHATHNGVTYEADVQDWPTYPEGQDYLHWKAGRTFGHPNANYMQSVGWMAGNPGSSPTWDWLEVSWVTAYFSCNNGASWDQKRTDGPWTLSNTNGPMERGGGSELIPTCSSSPKYGTYAGYQWTDFRSWGRTQWAQG
jgi:hypothetical protein